jgi:hypothetical protein
VLKPGSRRFSLHPRRAFAEVGRDAEDLGRRLGDARAACAVPPVRTTPAAQVSGLKGGAELLLHHLEQFPDPRRRDLLDGLLGKLAVADREVAVEPDLLGLVLGQDGGPAEAELELLRLPFREAQAES